MHSKHRRGSSRAIGSKATPCSARPAWLWRSPTSASADELVTQARLRQVNYGPNEDSPDRVQAAIDEFVDVSRLDRTSSDNRKGTPRC